MTDLKHNKHTQLSICVENDSYHIIWYNRPIPFNLINKMITILLDKKNMYATTNNQGIYIIRKLHPDYKKYCDNFPLTYEIMKNVCMLHVIDHVNHTRTILSSDDREAIVTVIENEKNNYVKIIRKLCCTYNIIPSEIAKVVLSNKGYNDMLITHLLDNTINRSNILEIHLCELLEIVDKYDYTSKKYKEKTAKIAYEHEQSVINYFKSCGIKLKSETEIVKEQLDEYGRAISTPDIVFVDPVYINGTRVYWLDYKDYIGTNIPLLFRANILQADKYVKRWGPGAFCYRQSFSDNILIPNVLLLDARSLPINLS